MLLLEMDKGGIFILWNHFHVFIFYSNLFEVMSPFMSKYLNILWFLVYQILLQHLLHIYSFGSLIPFLTFSCIKSLIMFITPLLYLSIYGLYAVSLLFRIWISYLCITIFLFSFTFSILNILNKCCFFIGSGILWEC